MAQGTWRAHDALIKALENRDREKAEALTLAQIENGRRFVLDYFNQQRKEP